MAVTIKQIADIAGVSIGTVDRALHNRSGVKADVADRIRQIADSLGYTPNIMAKALVLKKTQIRIGIVFHVIRNTFVDAVLTGMKKAIEEVKDFGIQITVRHSIDFDAEDQIKQIDSVLEEGVRALVLLSDDDERIKRKLIEIDRMGIRIVLVCSDISDAPRMAFIGCDSIRLGRLAAGIVNLICGGSGDVIYATSKMNFINTAQRVEGFKMGLEDRYPGMHLREVCELDNNQVITYRDAMELFQRQKDFDAIMIATAGMQGIFQAMEDSGLIGRIRIVALDLSKHVLSGIRQGIVSACVMQHPQRQGYAAIKLLTDYYIYNVLPKEDSYYIDGDIKIFENLF